MSITVYNFNIIYNFIIIWLILNNDKNKSFSFVPFNKSTKIEFPTGTSLLLHPSDLGPNLTPFDLRQHHRRYHAAATRCWMMGHFPLCYALRLTICLSLLTFIHFIGINLSECLGLSRVSIRQVCLFFFQHTACTRIAHVCSQLINWTMVQ